MPTSKKSAQQPAPVRADDAGDAGLPADDAAAEPAPAHVDYIATQQRRESLRAKLQKTH